MTDAPSSKKTPHDETRPPHPAPVQPAGGSPGPHDSEDIDESESTGGSALEEDARTDAGTDARTAGGTKPGAAPRV
jgi:hypothetical protein